MASRRTARHGGVVGQRPGAPRLEPPDGAVYFIYYESDTFPGVTYSRCGREVPFPGTGLSGPAFHQIVCFRGIGVYVPFVARKRGDRKKNSHTNRRLRLRFMIRSLGNLLAS